MTAYATLAQVKAALRITDTVDDTLIEMARVSASDLIDGYCGRTFTASGTVTRVFAPADNYVLQTDDLAGTALTITSSTGADGVFDVTWKASDYQLEPLNGVSNGQAVPFTRGHSTLTSLHWSSRTGGLLVSRDGDGGGVADGAGGEPRDDHGPAGERDPARQSDPSSGGHFPDVDHVRQDV